jgi:hypothetical protein
MVLSSAKSAFSRTKVFAANVYQQDELRGGKEVIRSFRAVTKSTRLLAQN